MGSKVISFRFDDDKLALLQQHQVDGESENQTAMRLLLSALGVEGKKVSLQSVDIVDNIRTEIKESIADGDIRYAIAHSYQSSINQFNGHLEELQHQIAELKKQMEELNPSAIDNSPSADNSQLPIPDPNKNQIQNIRTTLNRKNIKVSANQIRAAFKDAGWDGNNFNEIKKVVIELLSGAKP